jgi:hypothetical protein
VGIAGGDQPQVGQEQRLEGVLHFSAGRVERPCGTLLKSASENGTKAVRQIAFEGDTLDAMEVRLWREKVLGL